MKKPYMPLMMGDWQMLTSGMTAQEKGVALGLFIHQYHHGSLPIEIDKLVRIEPEVVEVWASLERLFPATGPATRHNPELEEVRAFWAKQSKNSALGGEATRKKRAPSPKGSPDQGPTLSPTEGPNTRHHSDVDIDPDQDLNEKVSRAFAAAFDERTLEVLLMHNKGRPDLQDSLLEFRTKVLLDWDKYKEYEAGNLRRAFQYHLRTINNPQTTNNGNNKSSGSSRKQQQVDSLIVDYNNRHGSATPPGAEGTIHDDSPGTEVRPV